MVGVPGRSKGCKTCRRRKKGCDLQRPFCGNCIKSRLTCEGYDRQWTFVENEPVVKNDTMTVVAKRGVSAATPPLRFLPDDLNRTAFENKALTLFWDLYLPKGGKRLTLSTVIGPHSPSWTEIVQDLNMDDRTLRPALLAVCLARIGESNKDPPLIQQGIKQYGKALLEMNQALQDKNRAQTDEVLATGKLMAAYEVCRVRGQCLRGLAADAKQMFHGSTEPAVEMRGLNWRSHTQGVVRLIEIRGPRQHTTRNAHRMFIDTRLSGIIAAIVSRKANFFSARMWTTVPWENEPKTIQDELHDAMALVPVLLEHFDLAQSCQDPAKRFQLQLILHERCKGVDGALQQWHRKLSSKLPRPFPAAIKTPHDRGSLPSPNASLAFEVGDYILAFTLALYWSTCVVVYGTMHLNLAAIRAIDPSAVTWEPPQRTDARQYAVSLSESLDYFMMPEMGLVGPQIISFPMGMALMYLAFLNDPDSLRVGKQLAEKMGSLSERGVSILTFMTSLQYTGVPKNPVTQAQGDSGWTGRAQSWFGAGPF